MKVFTFGCRLNTFESTVMQKIVPGMDDVFVINTCAVTSEAERQCRQAIRKIYRENKNIKIIVTGCSAQVHPEIYANMPQVYRVLGNREKLNAKSFQHTEKVMVSDINNDDFTLPLISDFEGRTRCFLQIQQGCNHYCTYCIIRLARGKNKGLPPQQIIDQATQFINNGYKELVLTGVDITSYPDGFNDLLRLILSNVKGLKRLRLGSLDPACIDDDFIDIMAKNPVLMPHVHLSIQSGDNTILKRMGRRHTFEKVVDICEKLRAVRPDITFGADFIAGFPTETDEQFNNTLELVKKCNISHIHAFPYSVRAGTVAAKMPMVDMEIRKNRAAQLRALGNDILNDILDSYIGKNVEVLTETNGYGYTQNYLKVNTNHLTEGDIISTHILKRNPHELVAKA